MELLVILIIGLVMYTAGYYQHQWYEYGENGVSPMTTLCTTISFVLFFAIVYMVR